MSFLCVYSHRLHTVKTPPPHTHTPSSKAEKCEVCEVSICLNSAAWSRHVATMTYHDRGKPQPTSHTPPPYTVCSSLTFLFLKACLARYPRQAAWNREMFLLVWTSRCSSSLDRVPALKNTWGGGGGGAHGKWSLHTTANIWQLGKQVLSPTWYSTDFSECQWF